MSLFNSWKIIVALTAIFGAGAFTGHVVTMGAVKREVEKRADVDEFTHQTMEKLRRELRLSPTQVDKIAGSVDDAGKQLKQEYDDTLVRILGILEEASDEIRLELSEDQKLKYDEMLAEVRARINRRLKAG